MSQHSLSNQSGRRIIGRPLRWIKDSPTSQCSQIDNKDEDECQQFDQIQYYQAGDIVFAKHEGYLWPAKIVKPLNNYAQYKIFLFEIKLIITFTMDDLIDYTPFNREKSIDMFKRHQTDEKVCQRFFKAIRRANFYQKQLKRKEEAKVNQQQTKSPFAKHSPIEQQIDQSESKSKQHMPKKKRGERPFKFSRQIKNILGLCADKDDLSIKRKTKMQQRYSLHHEFSINHQEIISSQKLSSNSSPKQSTFKFEQSVQEKPQCRKMRERLVHKSLNREYNYFINQKDIGRRDQLILEQKEMISYISLYQTIFEELHFHLASLPCLPQTISIKICKDTLDKLFKTLTQPKSILQVVDFLPLLKTILGKQLISIEKMVSQDILVRILIIIRTSKQMGCDSQFRVQAQYLQQHCRQLKIKYILGDECSISLKYRMQQIFKKTTFED